ncbi:hypothetical protein CYMTET_14566, partial [Cymbomonas tetramitiformis]
MPTLSAEALPANSTKSALAKMAVGLLSRVVANVDEVMVEVSGKLITLLTLTLPALMLRMVTSVVDTPAAAAISALKLALNEAAKLSSVKLLISREANETDDSTVSTVTVPGGGGDGGG